MTLVGHIMTALEILIIHRCFGVFARYLFNAYVGKTSRYWRRVAQNNSDVSLDLYPNEYYVCSNGFLLNNVWLFRFGRPTKHRIITTANIDNPKFEVVLLPTVRASSFLHDFLDRYLFAVAFHQLRHRNIGCVTALTFEWEMVVWYGLELVSYNKSMKIREEKLIYDLV